MTSQLALQLLLRLVPAIILIVTGFLVVRDERMRERWADLLVRLGSISSSKRDDPQVQQGIRLPFFVLGALFALWPVLYYFRDSYAQTPITPVPIERPTPTPTPAGPEPTPTPTPDLVTRPDGPPPGAPAGAAASRPPAGAPAPTLPPVRLP